MSKTIDYYISPVSPWTYLGHARFTHIAAQHGAAIRLKPFDLNKVFSLSGGLPLGQRAPQRQAYRLLELDRWRKALDVPLNIHPKHFPVNPEPASLLIIAATAGGEKPAMALTAALLRAVWHEDRDISDEATLKAIVQETGLAPDLLEQAPGAQERYRENTREATEAGVFGVPTYRIDGELFWGQDRLEFVDRALRG